jgi:hypothetical protein
MQIAVDHEIDRQAAFSATVIKRRDSVRVAFQLPYVIICEFIVIQQYPIWPVLIHPFLNVGQIGLSARLATNSVERD